MSFESNLTETPPGCHPPESLEGFTSEEGSLDPDAPSFTSTRPTTSDEGSIARGKQRLRRESKIFLDLKLSGIVKYFFRFRIYQFFLKIIRTRFYFLKIGLCQFQALMVPEFMQKS